MNRVIDFNWVKTKGAEDYVSALFNKGRRKQFGLLEKPSLPPDKNVNFVKYKVFLCGKSGSGKSSTLCNLLGQSTSGVSAHTPGIEVGLVHWPVRLLATGQILYFSLYFWDAGDHACKTFEHVLPACIENVDCLMLTFSFNDRQSFNEITPTCNQLAGLNQKKEPLKVILGAKTDQYIHSDLSDKEIHDVAEQMQASVLRISNVKKDDNDDKFEDISCFLNSLCNLLWLRDQNMVNGQ